MTLDAIEDALRVRAAYQVYCSVIQGIKKDKAHFKTKTLYNEVYQQDQVVFSTYHLVYYTLWSARNHLASQKIACPNVRRHLDSLILYYGLTELQKDSKALFDCGYFKAGHGALIEEAMKKILTELRPQYIGLIEAFDTPDVVLNSAVSNQYGDIYENYFNLARNSRMNRG